MIFIQPLVFNRKHKSSSIKIKQMDKKNYSDIKKDKKTYIRNGLIKLIFIGIAFFVLIFLLSCVWIGSGVDEQCKMAKEKYKGDCVEVLSQTLDDENNSFETRNREIWALGQLGDPRAFVVLEQYKTDQESQREPLDEMISQYELNKAINLVRGDFNITRIFWGSFVGN